MTKISRTESLPIASSSDVVRARQAVRLAATELELSLIDQTKLVTAASELARNTLEHGGGGQMCLQRIERDGRHGIRLIFTDSGRGIADIERALQDGYTSGNGMGLGLGGARRLMNDFEIESTPGEGTTITTSRWK